MGRKIKIYNDQTGETKIIDESELNAYNVTSGGNQGGSLSPQNATIEPITPVPTSEPQKPGIIQSILQPFINTAKNIGGAPIEAARASTLGGETSALDQNSQQLLDINKKLMATKDPAAKKILLAEAQRLTTEGEKLRQGVDKVSAVQNPFLSTEDFAKINTNPKGYVTQQVKDSANIASYGIPFGKGANLITKVLGPGAAIGAVQSATTPEAGMNWQTADEVAKGAAFGAAGAGVTALGGKILGGILNKTGKVSSTLEKGAQAIEEGQRQIRLKPSVYGAGDEKAVNETLTRWGVKGSPDKQYAALAPAMDKIESKIQGVIDANPTISVTKEEIKKSFMDNLQSSLRSKDLTQKQARTEIDGYLQDLVKASGGTGRFKDISLERLRELKKLVNADYGPVHDQMVRGGALSPRQKVIAAAWDSLDNAVKTASPEMKTLLKDESNLYKAARPLSAARVNPPTLRFMGTSIPAPIENAGKSKLVDVLRGTANKTAPISTVSQKVEGVTSTPIVSQIMRQAGARAPQVLPQVLSNGNQVPQNENNNNNPQNLQTTNTVAQPEKTATGYTLQQLGTAYSKAIQAGDKTAAAQLKDMYDIESSFQKTQGTGGKPLSVKAAEDLSTTQSGINGLAEVNKILKDDPSVLAKQLVPGQFVSRKFDSALFRTVEALLRLRTGAAAPEQEVRRYMRKFGPTFGDSADAVQFKLDQFAKDFANYQQNLISTQGSTEAPAANF